MLMDSGGIPKSQLNFPEPNTISSVIELEIFGDQLVRDGTVNYTLEEGGDLPDSYLTEDMLRTHMTPIELATYQSAKRQGLVQVLRKLNDKVRQRVLRSSKKAAVTEQTGSKVPAPAAGKKASRLRSASPASTLSPGEGGNKG
jgi:hypothetical protein